MSLLENAAKISEQGSQVISQGTAAVGQGTAALGQGLENIKNIIPKDINEFGNDINEFKNELGSKALDLREKGRTVVSNLNPMNIFSEFDRELKGVFRKVKSNACKMANTKEFAQIIETSVLDNVKKIAQYHPEKEGYGFFENLYMTLFLALMKYDNQASRLFMVDEYRFLILDVKNLNNQLLENTDNSITDKVLEKIGIKINQKEDLLKSLIQNILSKNEIFVSMLLNHSGFLTAMCQNEIFLKQIVEKKIFSTYGNEFTVQFVKQSKRKISKKELTKNEVKAFLKALNDISLNKGIQILAEKKETEEEQEGGADLATGATGVVGGNTGSVTDMATDMVTKAVENIDTSSVTGEVEKAVEQGLTTDATVSGFSPEAALGDEAGAVAAEPIAAMTTSSFSNMKLPAGMNMSMNPTSMLSNFGPNAAVPPPADKTGYVYMDLLKIKNQVSNTFARIREKICDILGRREFHEKLKELVFVEIEPQIQQHMNSLNVAEQQNPIGGNPENENFYKTYQKLFRYLKTEEKTREDVYQELEKYFTSILKKIQNMELETNLILKQKNMPELGRLKECLNLFIENVVMDNVFMTYLFENRDFCSVVFHQESFFDYIVHNLDENGFMGFLVEYWTTYRESDLENGNNYEKNIVNQNLTEEEKEDKQAIEEEGEKIEDESANEAEKKKKQQENIAKEKRKKYREFLLNLNRKLAPSDTMFGLFNGGEQDAQMGGACSDEIIRILEINKVEEIHKRLQKVIESSDIIDSYGNFLYKSFERLLMEDVMNLYKETLPPKGASDIFKETESFKDNNMYTEGDTNQDGIVSQLSGKGKEHLLVEFIVGFPDNKGYEVLIRYILTAEKLKHNRFFLFRKLFEMMGETDMIEFVSEYTAICEKVPDVKQSNLREGLGEGLGKVGEGLGEGLGKVGEGLGKVGKGLGKVGKPVGDWVNKHYLIPSRDGLIDLKNNMDYFGTKIQKDIQNNKSLNESGEYMKTRMPGNVKDKYFNIFNSNTEEFGKWTQEKVKNFKTNSEPTTIINSVNSLIGNPIDKNPIDNIKVGKGGEKKFVPPPDTPPPGTPPPPGNPPPGNPPLQSKKSPKEVVKQISGIISSGNVVAFLDPGLLSNLLRVDTINLLMDPQTIINFLKLVNKELLEKMTAEIPDTIKKMIEKIKKLVGELSVDLKDGSATFTEKETTADVKPDVKKGGGDNAPETTDKAPETETTDKAP